jgi:SNF2 family DNA or RNA helicase
LTVQTKEKLHGKVQRHGADWWVWTEPNLMMKLKRWFPRVNANRKGALIVRATEEVSRDLEWFLMRYPMEMKPQDREMMIAEASANKELEQDAFDILEGRGLKRELRWEVPEARDYQLIGSDLALRTGRLLIADDVGLGKTLTGMLAARDQSLLPMLIVCQTHLPQQFLDEINKFMPWLTVHIAKGTKPYKLADYHDGRRPDILIMGYSKLSGWAPALRGKVKSVLFDEGQELRRSGTQKYEAAGMVADLANCVQMTTATPVYNYGEEIFNIVEIYAPGALGTKEEFIREWGKYIGNHLGVKDPKALASYLKSQNLMIQRTRKEVGRELPETIKVPHAVESDEAEFERLMEGAEHNAELLASREASKEELFQLSGQFEWQMRRATGVAKAPYVGEFTKALLETGEQVVLFGWHHDVYDLWRIQLKEFNPAFYEGKASSTQKLKAKADFLSGESRVFIMSLRSGAGLDGLQAASKIAIFGELDWSPTMHEQCIGRLRRDGMDEAQNVLAYFLVSEHGSDPMIADTLNVKRGQSEPFMDPNAKLVEGVSFEGSKSQRMAEAFLKRR